MKAIIVFALLVLLIAGFCGASLRVACALALSVGTVAGIWWTVASE